MYIYNSHKDKVPFGAVKTGELSYYTFRVCGQDRPSSVYLVLRQADAGYRKYPCAFEQSADGIYIYSCVFSAKECGIYYYSFEVNYGSYKERVGRNLDFDAEVSSELEWQLTVVDSSYNAPIRWGSDIIYHVFVDRFNRSGEVKQIDYGTIHEDWEEDVDVIGKDGVYHANDFYGGNLRGIIDKLEYIKDLGVTILYLSPIFESHSNHRYDTADYMRIDPMIGTEEDFAELVGKARIYGMRVMLDGVFNHTGSDSKYFNKFGYYDEFGAYQGSASKYRDWYTFTPDGKYASWWGIDCVPTLNKNNKHLRKYLFGKDGAMAKWDKYDIDWRLDVVDELPNDFLDELNSRVKHDNPKATIIGEVWEDASKKYAYGVLKPYFTKGQIDGVMNYVFKNAILDYAVGGRACDFVHTVMNIVENYPKSALDNSMTMLGSHDTIRALNVLAGVRFEGWNKTRQRDYQLSSEQRRLATDRLFVASVLEYMLPGIPSIYYGDEVGLEGGEDPVNRRPYPWGKENLNILNHYKKLGVIRGKCADTLTGSTNVYDHGGLLIICRANGINSLMVVANTTGIPKNFPLEGTYIDLLTNDEYTSNIFMPNNSAVILIRK